VVHGLENFSVENFLAQAGEFFQVTTLPADASAASLLAAEEKNYNDASRLVVVTANANHLLVSRAEKIAEALPQMSERQRKPDVAQLHGILLEKVLGLTQESIAQQTHLHYVRDAEEATSAVRNGHAQIAFLMQPASLDQLRDVAFAGEVMPQKSTDFYPKLLSGLAIYALD
jgi:ABC-type phosphate/phosphonate transport system substrate-binding protein